MKQLVVPIVEKVLSQFVQAFVVALFGGMAFGWTAIQCAALAGVSAVITLALNSVNSAVIPVGMPFYTDLTLRVLRSGASAFLAFMVMAPVLDVQSGDFWKAALGAGAVGAVSALKAQGARQVGDPETAALLPATLDFIQPEPMAD